ncbi:MAG: DUF2071 domain-containing protein [Candidatus Synoicihabitans palmerolidicus]|nr:DUF2071 domain-containing protein [Candidatus Synoicihabitans palmerolidicus]
MQPTLCRLPRPHALRTQLRPRPSPDQSAKFFSTRRSSDRSSHFRFHANGPSARAVPGSLPFFLTERYLLFTYHRRQLRAGRVWHEPYALSDVHVDQADTALWVDQGFAAPKRKPDHALLSSGAAVSVYPMQRVP